MITVEQIVAAVGRKKLRDGLGVSDTAISNASARKAFPAKWYVVTREMCELHGVECPVGLFSFIQTPSPSLDGSIGGTI